MQQPFSIGLRLLDPFGIILLFTLPFAQKIDGNRCILVDSQADEFERSTQGYGTPRGNGHTRMCP